MVLGFFPSPHLPLSIYPVHFNRFLTFQDMARTGNTYEKWLRGDNSINITGDYMLLPSGSINNIHK